jgi:hypothetical protein
MRKARKEMCLRFLKITADSERIFPKPVKNAEMKFNENSAKVLIADTRSHRNGWTDVEPT